MASIKLKHASGNSTILNSPAANPSSDVTLKLPSTTGSAGQVLQVASANHSATNAELEFAAAAGGKFASYAVICDQKSLGTDGGTFTAGAWRTRDLNTELIDADGIVSISSNQFTLQAGTYFVEASAPAYKTNRHMIQLYQTSGSATNIQEGTSMYASAGGAGFNVAHLFARVTISGATTYEIRHYAESTETTFGFGIGTDLSTEIYTVVKIFKES